MRRRQIPLVSLVIFTILLSNLPLAAIEINRSPALEGGGLDDSKCPTLVSIALEKADLFCEGTGRDQVCYGHDSLFARPQASIDSFVFAMEGDREDLYKLKTLRLSALDPQSDTWGVALMQVGADLPVNQPDASVTLLLFGDVEVENAVPLPTEFETTVAVNSYVNVRRAPFETAGVLGTLGPRAPVRAIGRLADNSWIRMALPEMGRAGWLFRPLVAGDDAMIERLNIEEAWKPHYGPMQAFFLTNGGGSDPACAATTTDGLLIQTPEGVAEVNLLLNEVDVHITGTTLVQAEPGGEMTLAVLDGWVDVAVGGSKQTAVAGSQVSISLDDDGAANAPPGWPEPLETGALDGLPTSLLDSPVEIPTPLTPDEINDLLTGDSGADTDDTTVDASDTGDGNTDATTAGESPQDGTSGGTTSGDQGSTVGENQGGTRGRSGDSPGHGGENPGQGTGNGNNN